MFELLARIGYELESQSLQTRPWELLRDCRAAIERFQVERDEVLKEVTRYLSPENENAVQGDVVACIRDLAQVKVSAMGNAQDAMALLEQTEAAVTRYKAERDEAFKLTDHNDLKWLALDYLKFRDLLEKQNGEVTRLRELAHQLEGYAKHAFTCELTRFGTDVQIPLRGHVCGLMGYNPFIDPECPGCADSRNHNYRAPHCTCGLAALIQS